MRGLTFEKPKKRYSLSKCYANFLTILRIYRTTMILNIFCRKWKFWGFTNRIGFIKPFALNTLFLNQDFQDFED